MTTIDKRTGLSFAAAVLALGAILAFGVERPRDGTQYTEYFERVSEKMSAIPYRIGDWIGQDVDAQAPAIRILKPNKLLQRQYASVDGSTKFSLFMIHCTDARDMQGHYPPVCYPAHGWTIIRTERSDFVLGQSRVPCKVYQLDALRQGRTLEMTILNFFAVPSQQEALAADMSAVNRASLASSRSWMGAAQVQLIVHGIVPPEEMTRLMQEVSPAIESAVREVIHGDRSKAR